MTKRQRFAFEHPCFTEEDCAAHEYRWVRLPWSAILTLNIGLEDAPLCEGLPIWHSSLAWILPNGVPMPLEYWDEAGLKQCEQFIRNQLLGGVGNPARDATEVGVYALHVRRPCSDREIEELELRCVWPPRERDRWN